MPIWVPVVSAFLGACVALFVYAIITVNDDDNHRRFS